MLLTKPAVLAFAFILLPLCLQQRNEQGASCLVSICTCVLVRQVKLKYLQQRIEPHMHTRALARSFCAFVLFYLLY
jgi:hypothetical protein